MNISKYNQTLVIIGLLALTAYGLHLVNQDKMAMGVLIGFVGKALTDVVRNQFPVKNDEGRPSA